MIPQIDNSIDNTNLVNEVILPSRTYKLSSNYETQIKYGETQNVVGEIISLSDAAEVKLKKLDIFGNLKQNGTPSPSSPVDVNVVSGSNVINISNKNIFDYNQWLEHKQKWDNEYVAITKNYIISIMANRNDMGSRTPPMTTSPSDNDIEYLKWMSFPVESDTDYTIILKNENLCTMQILRFFYKENYSYINVAQANFSSEYALFTFRTTADTKFVSFRFDNESYSTGAKILKISEIQLLKGIYTISNMPNYESHQGKEFPLDLGLIELCKIGNYQDYFYKSGSKWYLHKEIEKIVLDGSEDWKFSSERFSLSRLSINTHLANSRVISNLYKFITASELSTEDYGIRAGNAEFLQVKNVDITSITDFKASLSTNNLIVYYILQNSTNTEITDTTLISQLDNLKKAKSYQGITYIYSSNEIGPILDIDYYPLSSIYYETVQVDRISGFIDDKDAIRQAVYHILSIERYSCLIYDDNYGVELQQYIGQDFEYLKVTIQKTLEEALMQDERIISIDVVGIEKIDNETANVKLLIQANVGEIQMEVNVNV